ncbi:aldehyde dehydrogenase family protein [Rhodobacteraceae bacterium B1Z28]|uniref:Aldehyde dehydrogenase family protein n=1 Tax=Ruegeria haliotis TaxID=2747601 RepID=A0ABX2PTD6_9RHOB|nr:aldehyde dehydrogenase family protein [Ruegeria haliotis]NVO57432.1 aldehyde dehydrogenase family protein [Ruegeria haliotis]
MSSNPLLQRNQTVFINGEWRDGGGAAPLSVVNPSNGEIITQVPTGGAGDVEAAAAAAAAAFGPWKATPSTTRAGYLRAIAKGLAARHDQLVNVQMTVSGKPQMESEIDVGDAIACFEYYAGLADGLDAAQDAPVSHAGGDHMGRVRHEPVGPVGMIVPWNFPLVTSAWKLAPALAAGCTAVMKTSEMTPLIELAYGDIAVEIGLPAGVINIVTGGADVGIAISAAPEFRKVSFTGSNMVGALVMQAVSKRCLPIALELGGKSPIIVTEDADLDTALDCVLGGVFYNAGQMCSATSRLMVHESLEAKLIEGLAERAKGMRVSSPFDEGCEMGPITTRAQFTKIREYLDGARADGLTCVAGGDALADGPGNFIAPTIYRNVPHDNRIWREEVFGPVLATTTFRSDEEAIRIANDTHYGLVGSVVCADPARGNALCDGIEAGQIWYNTPQIVYPDSAWGGFKASGIGRELGPWGLSGFQGVKHVTSPM